MNLKTEGQLRQELAEAWAMLNAERAANSQNKPTVAYLFTNVQSGFQIADCDPDWHADEREMWHRQDLVLKEKMT